jgi:hypothetical protein
LSDRLGGAGSRARYLGAGRTSVVRSQVEQECIDAPVVRVRQSALVYAALMVTFSISQVEPAREPCPQVDTQTTVGLLAGGPIEAWSSPGWPLIKPPLQCYIPGRKQRLLLVPCHPFVGAVHAAFEEHRPLELSPDMVWLCIAQGFATHVRLHAEKMRHLFVSFEGRATLKVRRDDFVKGSPGNDWSEVFGEFSRQIQELTGPLHGLVVSDFSTTDVIARAASEVVLMEAASPYVAFKMFTRCGIPSLSLTGTVADWQLLRERAARLAPYETGWWIDALLPVLDQFVAAMKGRVDRDFWASFYKFKNVSGGPFINGWINVLLPYLGKDSQQSERNPAVTTWGQERGPDLHMLPTGLATAPMLWRYLDKEFAMNLRGGFVGVGQNPDSLTVRPEIGWAVQPRSDSSR